MAGAEEQWLSSSDAADRTRLVLRCPTQSRLKASQDWLCIHCDDAEITNAYRTHCDTLHCQRYSQGGEEARGEGGVKGGGVRAGVRAGEGGGFVKAAGVWAGWHDLGWSKAFMMTDMTKDCAYAIYIYKQACA